MLRIDHFMTATQFIRSFQQVTSYLSRTPAPLLISQKKGSDAATLKIHFPLIVLLPRVLLDLHHVAITGVACWANTIDRYGHWRWLV